MNGFRRRLFTLAMQVAVAGCSAAWLPAARAAATLQPYASEAELARALDRWREQARRQQEARRRESSMAEQNAPVPAAPAAGALMSKSAAAPAAAEADSITNVQTAGVDEGGIVKRAGEHLVILRRGRLFTVRVGGDALQPVATLDAYAPGADPQGAWYDELLVSGSTVLVIGYSYARGGTEVGRFELGSDGGLRHGGTWHLRSNDYYSSRNYASRLVGSRLVFYTPMMLHPWQADWAGAWPAVRRWHPGALPAEFQRILPATRVYRTDDEFDPAQPLALHTVTSCELSAPELRCESSAVLGPTGRVFYVSAGSVYVWTSAWPRRRVVPMPYPPYGAEERPSAAERSLSAVFRIPLDGAAPTALKTAGVPVDQLSFLEDESAHLNVLLRESGRGEGMWGSERTQGKMALLRVPLAAFGDGRQAAGREHYRALPAPGGGSVQNRYVGDWLLWGAGNDAHALRYAGRDAPARLDPGHGVERIEALGQHALLVGNRGADLTFTSVRLDGATASIAGSHVLPGMRQGETRTHGFFYRPADADTGLLGLPVLAAAGRVRPGGVHAGAGGAASVVFLRQRQLSFVGLGDLNADGAARGDDACKASCVDWYGNARPIFLGDRVVALLGYELVEGRLEGGWWRERIVERRRVSFAPVPPGERRHDPFN